MTGEKQYRTILAHLKAGGKICGDTCEVPKFANCKRLPARICEMRKAGYSIGDVWIVGRTGTKIKQYAMLKEAGHE